MATATDVSRGRSLAAAPDKPRRKAKGIDPKRAMDELGEIRVERDLHLPNWRTGFNYTQPDRKTFDGEQPGQSRQAPEVFDSYPVSAAQRGTGNIIAALVPPGGDWCEAASGHLIPKNRREALAKGLEEITETAFNELNASNFSTEVHTMGADMLVASAFMAIDYGDVDDPLACRTASMNEMFPAYDARGNLRAVYRDYECEVRDIREQWPAARLSSSMERKAQDTPRAKVRIVEADVFEAGVGWNFAVIDPGEKVPLFERPASDPTEPCRWIVAGFYKRPGDRYHYGPAQIALPTMRTANKVEELELKSGAKSLAPPVLIDSRAGLNPHTVRFGANMVGVFDGSQLGGGSPFQTLPPSGMPQWSEHKMDRYHAIIDAIFFAEDVIPPVSESRSMTAYEVQVRKQMLLVQQGVNLGRLERELPHAVFRRVVWLLVKHGHIDAPGFRIDGRKFRVEPRGPLARAREAEKSAATLGFVSQARAALGDQMTALGIKLEDVAATAAEASPDISSSLIRDQQEREQLQKSAAEAAAAQAAAGQTPQMAQSALPQPMQ